MLNLVLNNPLKAKMNSGYSSTPLSKKLGIKDNFICSFYNAPKTYISWFNSLDIITQLTDNQTNENLDFAHAFCKTDEELEQSILLLKPKLKKNGMLWISWPKGSSKIKTSLKREPIRDYVLAQGLVDVKVAAIDENWSGLKFVYRLKDRT